MFDSITSHFSWSEPGTLVTLHDREWTAIRMAKTARKQGLRDVRNSYVSFIRWSKRFQLTIPFL